MFKYFKYLLSAQLIICQIYTGVSATDDWFCNDEANATIPVSKVCDGSIDCSNKRDELSRICVAKLCKENEYRCAYGACISAALICNKQIDCYDRSDETDFLCDPKAFDENNSSCSEEGFKCDSGECIDELDMCNGFPDCKDASDETVNSCAHLQCSYASFRCAYGACISLKLVANQVWDCADGSDELAVDVVFTDSEKEVEKTKTMPLTCSIPYDKPNLLISLNKTGKTLEPFQKILLNDRVDFRCLTGFALIGVDHLTCVNNDWYRQWPHCERTTPKLPCRASEVACQNGDCIEKAMICNGVKDCADGSDEILPKCLNITCTENEFKCTYGACIPRTNRCDGKKDCADGSDETSLLCLADDTNYTQIIQGDCDIDEATCGSGSNECILVDDLCNGIVDCSNWYDESVEMCAHFKCSAASFPCAYGACIRYTALCDGEVDCADGSDEYAELCTPIIEEKETYEAKYNCDDSYSANLEKFDAIKEKEILVEELITGTSSIKTENDTTKTSNTIHSPETKPARKPIIQAEIRALKRRCIIPDNRLALRATNRAENVTLKIGSQIDSNTIVTFSCEETWYLVDGDTDVLCMVTGEWSSTIPKCEKRCPPHWSGISTYTKCMYKNEKSDCQGYSKPHTTATVTCTEGYTRIPATQNLSCGIDGEWDKAKIKCQPKCDTESKDKISEVNIFILSPDIRNSSHIQYRHICSGTILSPRLVLTSSSCFNYNDLENTVAANDPILYTILPSSVNIQVFGQYEQLNGRHNISQIIIAEAAQETEPAPAIVVLVDYFVIVPTQIMPICLKFPLSCGSKKNESTVSTKYTPKFDEGTAMLNSEACLVVFGLGRFIYMDDYQQWLEMKMKLYNYLL